MEFTPACNDSDSELQPFKQSSQFN